MATLEDTIYRMVTTAAGFQALAGDRLYPVDFPQAPVYPAALYMVPSRAHYMHMDGVTQLARARIQADAFAETYDEAVALADVIRAALNGFRGVVDVPVTDDTGQVVRTDAVEVQGIFCTIDRDEPESGTRLSGPKVRRRLLEFTVWV